MTTTIDTDSEADTERAGEQLGRDLRPGDVVLLYGELGAGKTAFVRGLARGIGASADEVSSPTFTLVQEYRRTAHAPSRGAAEDNLHGPGIAAGDPVSLGGALTLYHVDLYRLDPHEVDDLGLDDLVAGDGIVAIEWADRWRGRPGDTVEVRLEETGDQRRRIRITRD